MDSIRVRMREGFYPMRRTHEGGRAVDVLSELLKSVTLNAAIFYNAEFSAPWSVRSPASKTIAPLLAPGAGHVIIYHLVVDGAAWAQVADVRVPLQAGDVVMFPHGDAHLLGNGDGSDPVDNGKEIARILAQGLQLARMGGGGEVTRFVCGYLACDPQLGGVLLAGLPALVKVNIRSDGSGAWVENSIRSSVASAASQEAGAVAVLAKLSEALLTETLRRYVAALPEGEKGWLAGARDPQVGKALRLLHGEPLRDWTVAELAAAVGLSRAVLAERFRHFLGQPPMAYLAKWRMQLGARLLRSGPQGVAEIASQVGYDSEAAFNRASKREFGIPPARFRREAWAKRANATATPG